MRRRKQNSSCDECRKARLGCNASSTREEKCSNCIRRNRPCTKEGIQRRKENRRRGLPDTTNNKFQKSGQIIGQNSVMVLNEAAANLDQSLRQSQSSSISPFGMEQTACRIQQSSVLHNKLWDVFSRVFEPRLSLWNASGCCPFQIQPISMVPEPFMWRLVTTLDMGDNNMPTQSYDWNLGQSSEQAEDNDAIHQALVNAIHAFSVRWLSIHDGLHEMSILSTAQSQEALSDSIWQQARQTMYPIMSKPSYRSILALQIFGMTPFPPQTGDQRISDLCTEIAINQQNRLQPARKITQPSTSNACISNLAMPSRFDQQTAQKPSLHSSMQDVVFWFSVACDTGRSLTQCCSSILLPNRTGNSKVWNFVKNRIQEFNVSFQSVRRSRMPLSDKVANIILQYASAGQKMFWSAVIETQDVLYRYETNVSQETVLNSVFQQWNYFDEIFGSHLDQCGREFMFLNEQNQISYLLVVLHFHLATLIFVDSLSDHVGCYNIAWDPHHLRNSSCRAIVNAASLALQLDRTVPKSGPQTSILLLDPNPKGSFLALSRAGSSVFILYDMKDISAKVAATMFSVIVACLDIISKIYPAASDSLLSLEKSFSDLDFRASKVNTLEPKTATHMTATNIFEPPEDPMKELREQPSSAPTFMSASNTGHDQSIFLVDNMLNSDSEFPWQDLNLEDYSQYFEMV